METRERILEAAARIMSTKGIARATTREIAREAGFSEGTLYNYFESKERLFLAVLSERLPGFIPLIKALHGRVGQGSIRQNLEEVVRMAIAFYVELLPMTTAAMAAPRLREGLRHRSVGPHRANEGVAAYLRREQQLGRIHADASPEAAAALLLGACQQRAVHSAFLGIEADAIQDEGFVQGLVGTLMQGLRPAE